MKYTLARTVKQGFSIIEVMIGVFIFSLGLVAIYALLMSSLNLSEYNKNAIIASQLAVEQIEMIRNIRDTNYSTVRNWDSLAGDNALTKYVDDHLKVENGGQNGYILTPIDNFKQGRTELSGAMKSYRLCLDNSIYTYNCNGDDVIPTPFYRYLKIESRGDDKLLLISKVIWYSRGYHEYEIQTLITDWRRL